MGTVFEGRMSPLILFSVPHDTLASTVCAGVRDSTAAVYEQAVAMLSQERVDPYRQAVIRGLGCVSNHTVAQRCVRFLAFRIQINDPRQ